MGALTNSIDADQMPQNVDYDQDLLCLPLTHQLLILASS